mmetsp:Transcript_67011/g.179116  ORF Transcript_67011/g.179116 Transcript_67011/m.179116 type:complete len:92 (-) Transcript_67011:309-584(-)
MSVFDQLQVLDISRNRINWIGGSDLPESLLHLETSYNSLQLMDISSWSLLLDGLPRLRTLDGRDVIHARRYLGIRSCFQIACALSVTIIPA